MRWGAIAGGGVLLAGITASSLYLADTPSKAADHLDPPTRTDPDQDSTPDKAADIADVYAWHTDQFIIIAVDFAGPQANNLPATYDRDVLYNIFITNNNKPLDKQFEIDIRFGQDGSANGVRISGVPGTTGPIVGPVETDLVREGVTARAGLFDDPFFFDLQGFRATRSTGALSISNTRNFFAGQNLTGVVLQIPRAALYNGVDPIRIWAATSRFGGQK